MSEYFTDRNNYSNEKKKHQSNKIGMRPCILCEIIKSLRVCVNVCVCVLGHFHDLIFDFNNIDPILADNSTLKNIII